MRSGTHTWLVGAIAALCTACTKPPHLNVPFAGAAVYSSPLKPSYVLVSEPTDQNSLLGRSLLAPPEPGQSLENALRPNPCVDKLTVSRSNSLSTTFEDAEALEVGGAGRTLLAAFGLAQGATSATHFLYKVKASRQVERLETTDYDDCCGQKECGYGFVSELIYGDGEYAVARKTQEPGPSTLVVATSDETALFDILQRRKVQGWLVAVITVTDGSTGTLLGPLGAVSGPPSDRAMLEAARQKFAPERLSVASSTVEQGFLITDGRQESLTENEFVRRYKAMTGSSELDDHDRLRGRFALYGIIGSAVALATGAVLLATGDAVRNCEGDKCGFAAKDYAAVGALSLGAVGVPGFAFNYSPGGDATTDHYLSEKATRFYVERYNRVGLRRTLIELKNTAPARSK